MVERAAAIAALKPQKTERAVRLVMAGIQSAHALEASDRVVRAAECDKRGATIIMRGNVAGLARNGIVEQRARVGLTALCRSNDTEVVDDGGMAGRKRERRAIVRFGLPEAAGAVMRGCKRNKLAECFARRQLRYSGGPPALTTLQDSPRHRVNPLLTSLARSANGTFVRKPTLRELKTPPALAAFGAFFVPEPLGACLVLAAGVWWLCRKPFGRANSTILP